MTCPICGMPSAWNAPESDQRCGPCYNFRVEGFTKYGAILVREDFDVWIKKTAEEIWAANNMKTYARWLDALRVAMENKAWD